MIHAAERRRPTSIVWGSVPPCYLIELSALVCQTPACRVGETASAFAPADYRGVTE